MAEKILPLPHIIDVPKRVFFAKLDIPANTEPILVVVQMVHNCHLWGYQPKHLYRLR